MVAHVCYEKSPLGNLRIVEQEGWIVQLLFEPTEVPLPEGTEEGTNEVLEEAVRQLREYFSGQRQEFVLPLKQKGTDFQQRVWKALIEIPYGETKTYRDIAESIGCPKGCRAVGMANHRNRLMIVVPCHRVIGADGTLTGYAAGIERKEGLLQLEKKKSAKFCKNGKD